MVGHGVGHDLHEEPQVPNYGRQGQGVKLKMCIRDRSKTAVVENTVKE